MLSLARVQRCALVRAARTATARAASTHTAAMTAARPFAAAAPRLADVRSLSTQAAPAQQQPPMSLKAKQQLEWNNVTEGISSKIGRNLHLQPGYPLNIIKNRIAYYFEQRAREQREAASRAPPSPTATAPEVHEFVVKDNVSPRVTVAQNFDELLFPADHPGRSLSDTFYFDRQNLLRTHTTAHEVDFLREGLTNFLTVGDCYRRDEIDASHYPVFHQMEGVRIFPHDMAKYGRDAAGVERVAAELKATLEGLVRFLFGSDIEVRWVEGSFPFTTPSFEMEILFQGKWMEVLGCGVLQYAIMDAAAATADAAQVGRVNGWAFGLGLERLAMILFDIPDIRLFWSEDARFLDQFKNVREDLRASGGRVAKIKFQPFSKYPACFKDVSFWVPEEKALPEPHGSSAGGEIRGAPSEAATHAAPVSAFHENDLCSLVREVAGDLVENVACIDSFVHPKTRQTSKCYRIMYRSLARNLTNEEIDVLQEQIRAQIPQRLGLKLR